MPTLLTAAASSSAGPTTAGISSSVASHAHPCYLTGSSIDSSYSSSPALATSSSSQQHSHAFHNMPPLTTHISSTSTNLAVDSTSLLASSPSRIESAPTNSSSTTSQSLSPNENVGVFLLSSSLAYDSRLDPLELFVVLFTSIDKHHYSQRLVIDDRKREHQWIQCHTKASTCLEYSLSVPRRWSQSDVWSNDCSDSEQRARSPCSSFLF